MTTHRNAYACVLFACILLSCHPGKKTGTELKNLTVSADAVSVSEDPPMNFTNFHENYIGGSRQRFTVRSKKPTVVTARGGLRVTIDPASLEKEDGTPVKGMIGLVIIEFTNSMDLFKANVASVSDGELLQSGGSYFVGLESDGQKVRIKAGKDLKMEFPVLGEKDMELFYGERDSLGNMNWTRTWDRLVQKPESIDFVTTNNEPVVNGFFGQYSNRKLFRSLGEDVYYYDKKVSVQGLLDIVNKKIPRLRIDTVNGWPLNLPTNTELDTNFLNTVYGPRFLYRIINNAEVQRELESNRKRDSLQKNQLASWKPETLAGKIQKYYAPASVRKLGWINCDRFNENQQIEMYVDLPQHLQNSKINYFVIFRSFMGLVPGSFYLNADGTTIIRKMPIGESVTLVAFAKSNGIIYQCKEEFVVEKKKKVTLKFNETTHEELTEVFEDNVRI